MGDFTLFECVDMYGEKRGIYIYRKNGEPYLFGTTDFKGTSKNLSFDHLILYPSPKGEGGGVFRGTLNIIELYTINEEETENSTNSSIYKVLSIKRRTNNWHPEVTLSFMVVVRETDIIVCCNEENRYTVVDFLGVYRLPKAQFDPNKDSAPVEDDNPNDVKNVGFRFQCSDNLKRMCKVDLIVKTDETWILFQYGKDDIDFLYVVEEL